MPLDTFLLLLGVLLGLLTGLRVGFRRPPVVPVEPYHDTISPALHDLRVSRDRLLSLSYDLLVSERERRRHEAFRDCVMDHLPVCVWVKDEGFRYLYGNREARLTFSGQESVSGWVGHPDAEFFPDDVLALSQETDVSVLRTGTADHSLCWAADSLGCMRPWLIVKWRFAVPDAAPAVGGCAIDISDVLASVQDLPPAPG